MLFNADQLEKFLLTQKRRPGQHPAYLAWKEPEKEPDHDPARSTLRTTAKVLASRLRDRTLTAVEVLEAHLRRIEEHNPKLHAVVSLDAERARQRAQEADRALSRGELWGPLHGVPLTLKDGHDVAGLRTTVGTNALDRIADQDGTVAARLRAAGAIIIGHSNVPPWLSDHQTQNPIFDRTLHAFSNLTGLPGLAVPAAIDGGLPIGIQLVGPRWSELRLLRIARALERERILPGFQPAARLLTAHTLGDRPAPRAPLSVGIC